MRRRLKPYSEVIDPVPAWEREWQQTMRVMQRLCWLGIAVMIFAFAEMIALHFYMSAFDMLVSLMVMTVSLKFSYRVLRRRVGDSK